jgi:tetratricopeptide (TPR) repeat protein
MKKLFYLCAVAIASLTLVSCGTNFDQLLVKGKYKEAEKCIQKMKGLEKYNCAEALINEYVELEEYDRAIYVYEKCTPEHCDNDQMKFPNLYCHGANYELTVTALFRKIFMRTGDYDKVWQYSAWDSNDDSGYNAEAYYQFMSDVILYLCSTGNKAEANTFLNHYVYWFDVKIDNSSEYSTEKPQFMCDIVRGKLQRIINTY